MGAEHREGDCRWEGWGGRRGWISPGNKSVDAPLSPDKPSRERIPVQKQAGKGRLCPDVPQMWEPVEADFSFRLSCLPNDFCFTAQLDCVH